MVARHLQRLAFGTGVEAAFGFSQAVRVDEAVYVSGQYSAGADGGLVDAHDLDAQLVRTFANLARVLDGVGASRRQVVRTNVLVVGLVDRLPKVAAAHQEFFGSHRPATTAVGVSELAFAGQLVEVEATVRLDHPA